MAQRSNRFLAVLTAVIAAGFMTATAAMAAKIVGDDGPNTLTGTDGRDLIRATPAAAAIW
jgi:hypothetical protein